MGRRGLSLVLLTNSFLGRQTKLLIDPLTVLLKFRRRELILQISLIVLIWFRVFVKLLLMIMVVVTLSFKPGLIMFALLLFRVILLGLQVGFVMRKSIVLIFFLLLKLDPGLVSG